MGKSERVSKKALQVPAPAKASLTTPKNEREAPAGKGKSKTRPDRRERKERQRKRPNNRPGPRGSLDRPNVFRSFGIPPRAANQMGIHKMLWIFWILSSQERTIGPKALRTELRPATIQTPPSTHLSCTARLSKSQPHQR